jgi:hypothetical protein
MTTTDVLALWGAIIATATATWTILRDSSDRGKVAIDVSVGRFYPTHQDQDILFITITNVGKRPVLIKSWGMKLRKPLNGKEPFIVIVPRGLPRVLNETDYHNEWTHDVSWLTEDVEHLWVLDSSGKHWHAPKKQLRRAIEDARKITLKAKA